MKGLCLGVALLASAAIVFAAPPPVTDAEKAACEIVADHLARGPIAIAERLAKGAPLATLRREAAVSEIAARVGPREGASWELRTAPPPFAAHGAVFHVVFPSGIDDVLIFDMVQSEDRWMVQGIRTLAEAPPGKKTIPRKSAPTSANPPSTAAALQLSALVVWVTALLAPLLAIGGAAVRKRIPRGSSAILCTALLSFSVCAAFVIDPQLWSRLTARAPTPPAVAEAKPPFLEMRQLAPLRRALATGEEGRSATTPEPEAQEVAKLWQAAATLGRVPAEQTLLQIASAKTLAESPLALLLRARVAAREGDSADAFTRYAAIRAIEPEHDAFWLEQALVSSDEEQARRSAPLHSRDVYYYYGRFVDQLSQQDETAARKALQEAWRVQPLSRASVVSGAFGVLLRDPAVALLINVNTPDEQKSADFDLGRRPMRVPPEMRSAATGMFVRLSHGTSRLDIPGGSAIAPANTSVVSARDFERDERAAALRAVEGLSALSLASAAAQRTMEAAAEALAEHNNWQRIIDLTDAITPDSDNIPASLVTWRVRALIRANRFDDARQLATGPAVKHAMQRVPDAGSLLQISELLAATGAWSEAIEMVRKASSIKNAPDVSGHLRRLELRRILATSPAVQTTTHFEIHTSADVPVTVPERIGDLLEAELQRLLPRFRLAAFRPVRVNVVGWKEFSKDLTRSNHVVGFYDGEITIPFGEVASFRESIVSILTHELTHAIVAQASSDNAPHWFQEGIASRMELVERQENIFQVRPTQQFIALELVDPTLLGSIDPEAVGDAYLIAQTFMHFLEDRHGVDSVNRLIDAFRAGSSTEESLVAVTGQTISTIDRDFRAWGNTHSGPFLDTTPWPYARFYSLGIDPKVRAGIRFSRPRPKPEERRP